MDQAEYKDVVLKRLRAEAANYNSSTEMAKALGISKQVLSNWFHGQVPKKETIKRCFPDLDLDDEPDNDNLPSLNEKDYIGLVSYAIEKKIAKLGSIIKIAEELDVTRQTVANWKSGKTDIPFSITDSYFHINNIMKKEFLYSEYLLKRNLNSSSDLSVSAFIKLAKLHGYSLVIRSDESSTMSIGEFNKLIKSYGCHIDLI